MLQKKQLSIKLKLSSPCSLELLQLVMHQVEHQVHSAVSIGEAKMETKIQKQTRVHHTHLLFLNNGKSKSVPCRTYTFSSSVEFSNLSSTSLNSVRDKKFVCMIQIDSNGKRRNLSSKLIQKIKKISSILSEATGHSLQKRMSIWNIRSWHLSMTISLISMKSKLMNIQLPSANFSDG